MSYEGRREYLCSQGHYHTINEAFLTYGRDVEWPSDSTLLRDKEKGLVCVHCGSQMVWEHDINDTNGRGTCAARERDGYTDVEKRDHRGNVYYDQLWMYRPAAGSAWERISERVERERQRDEKMRAKMRYYLKCDINGSDGGFIDHVEIFEITPAEQNNGVPSWVVLSWACADIDTHAQYVENNTFKTAEQADAYLEKWKVQLNEKLASMDIVTFQDGAITVPEITIAMTSV